MAGTWRAGCRAGTGWLSLQHRSVVWCRGGQEAGQAQAGSAYSTGTELQIFKISRLRVWMFFLLKLSTFILENDSVNISGS